MKNLFIKIFAIALISFVAFMGGRVFESISPSQASYELANMGVSVTNSNHVLQVEYIDGVVYNPIYWEAIATLAPHYEHVRLVSP
jgi:hypothetical protein